MTISIIIPTYNESAHIGELICDLKEKGGDSLVEVIVVDGGSDDDTVAKSKKAGAKVFAAPVLRRSVQMNLGAKSAQGDVLYFVHADIKMEVNYPIDIQEALSAGYSAGCYRYKFDSAKPLLRINAFFTRFEPLWCRGGDQTLFITRDLFDELGGFQEDLQIMEDYDIIEKIRQKHRFRIIPSNIVVSARKYDSNSYLRVQFANFLVFTMYFWGASQSRLVSTYKRLLKY